MKELIAQLHKSLKTVAESSVLFNDSQTPLAITIDASSVIPLHPLSESDAGPILFIDGGEGIVFEAASFCLAHIRIAGVVFDGIQRVRVYTKDQDVLFERRFEGDGKRLNVELTANGITRELREAFLQEARTVCTKFGVGALPGLLRTMMEYEAAVGWSNESQATGVVMDGLLERGEPFCISKRVLINNQRRTLMSVAKTSSLTCTNGRSVVAMVRSMASEPGLVMLGSSQSIIRAAVLFHAQATSAFVVNVSPSGFNSSMSNQKSNTAIVNVLGSLIPLAQDVSWLGYPYPLVLVDQLGRVSMEEIQTSRIRAQVLVEEGKELKAELASKESHKVLDQLRY